jgi:hypothetical protein
VCSGLADPFWLVVVRRVHVRAERQPVQDERRGGLLLGHPLLHHDLYRGALRPPGHRTDNETDFIVIIIIIIIIIVIIIIITMAYTWAILYFVMICFEVRATTGVRYSRDGLRRRRRHHHHHHHHHHSHHHHLVPMCKLARAGVVA